MRLIILLIAVAQVGCAPRLIQDYSIRDDNFVFAVQEGRRYQLGECKRAPNGDLVECVMYDVEFDE